MAASGTTLLTAGRALRRLALTAAIFGIAAAAILGGGQLIAQRAAAILPPPAAPLTPVAVAEVSPQPGYAVTRRFIGQVEAPGRIDLGFELGGRIVDILAQEGDRVRAGATLARLDTASLDAQRAVLQAERAALAADAELARLTLARSDQLARGGFRSESARDDARFAVTRLAARLAAIEAQMAGVDIQIRKSSISAPFDAVVGHRLMDPGQDVGAGTPVLRLFELAAPQLRVGLPAALAGRLALGDAVGVEVEGARLEGRVLRLRADLDAVTRTRGVVVALPDAAPLAFGQTGHLVLEEEVAEPGFWAPVAALREGVRGSWTVFALADGAAGPTVVPAAVEVIHMAGERVFLRGTLAPRARIVLRAPDRVAIGQPVALLGE